MDFETYVAICQASKQPRIKHATSEVCGLGKTRLETVGSAEVQISTVGLVPFTIVKFLGHQAILGSDQLSKGNANFDFESDTLVWNGQNFALYPCADSAPVAAEISTFQRTGAAEIDKLLAEFADIIDQPNKPLASTAVEAEIPTDSRPIRQRAYRAPLSKRKIISDQIDDMLNQGIIDLVVHPGLVLSH